MNQLEIGLEGARKRRLAHSPDPAHGVVPGHAILVDVPAPQPHPRGCDRDAELLLAPAQRCLGALLAGHIGRDRGQRDDSTVAQHGGERYQKVRRGPVRERCLRFQRNRLTGFDDALHRRAHVPVRLTREFEQAVAGDLGDRPAGSARFSDRTVPSVPSNMMKSGALARKMPSNSANWSAPRPPSLAERTRRSILARSHSTWGSAIRGR